LRVTVDGAMVHSQAYRAAEDLLRDLASWRQQFAGKAWVPVT
jgi:hypothetical protein